jgi:hypothetical protein
MGDRSFLTGYLQLCEAETAASGCLPGAPVRRLVAIADGGGICATHVAAPLLADIRTTADQHRRRHNN